MQTSKNQSQFTAAFIYSQGLQKINFFSPKLLKRRWLFFMCNNVGRNLHLFLGLLDLVKTFLCLPAEQIQTQLCHTFIYSTQRLEHYLGWVSLMLKQSEDQDHSLGFFPSTLHMLNQWEPHLLCLPAWGAVEICASGFSSAYRLPCKAGYFILLSASKRQNGTA